MNAINLILDLLPEEPSGITVCELMKRLGFYPHDSDYDLRKDYILQILEELSACGKVIIKTVFSRPKLITKYIPLLQKAKKNGFITPNPRNIDSILFLKKHRYVLRDENGSFILSHKGEWLVEEYKKKKEVIKKWESLI